MLVDVSSLSFLQCFEVLVGCKNLCHLSQKVLFPDKYRKKTEEQLTNP